MTSHLKLAEVYYHNKYPGSLIFYRIGENFVAFMEDAKRAATVLRKPIQLTADGALSLSIVRTEFLDCVDLLSVCDIEVHGITYRNDEGKFAIPDVKLLQEEEDMDY